MNYPSGKPHIGDQEKKYVMEVLDSGVLALGPFIKRFEVEFAKKVGTKYAVSVSSGTAGLHIATMCAGLKPGDEVITTPFSFIASSNCILYVGAKPIFVDVDPVTYNIDPKEIEKHITKKTKAILVVHIFGQSADMKAIMKIAKKYKLKIIEDACESLMAENYGKNVGTFGESAVFAFYPNKQMTTGEGGMLVTDNKKIYELACSLRNQGRDFNPQWLDHKILGYNFRMDEMSAAVGLAQVEKIDWLISERQKLAALYDKHFAKYSDRIQLPLTGPGNNHTWFVYAILFKNKKVKRDEVINKLAKIGISTKPYLPSIHLFKFYKDLGWKKGDFPISERTSNSSLALPFYIGLKEEDVKQIVEKVVELA
ncbi:MAG: DegT/DnrJ/EryC1/StrS family aminotransferase [bacterium]|nr:DegT/DnrJ/EryC1/StrS family aminotransferase [bacterium]